MTPSGSTSASDSAAVRFGTVSGAEPSEAKPSVATLGTTVVLVCALGVSSLSLWAFGYDALLEALLDRGLIVVPSSLIEFFLLTSLLLAAGLASLWACFAPLLRSDRMWEVWIGVFGLIGLSFVLRASSGSVQAFAGQIGIGLLGVCLLGGLAGRLSRPRLRAGNETSHDFVLRNRVSLMLCMGSLSALAGVGASVVAHATHAIEGSVELPLGGTLRVVLGPWSTSPEPSPLPSSSPFMIDDAGQVVELLSGGVRRTVQPASRSLGAASDLTISPEGQVFVSAASGGGIAQFRDDGSALGVARIDNAFGEVAGLSAAAEGLLWAKTDDGYRFLIELPGVDGSNSRISEDAVHRVMVGSVTETSASLGWLTSTPHRGAVSVWTDGKRVQRVVESAAGHEHGITLVDLEPDRIHHFTIETPLGASHVQHFRTLPAPDASPQFTMAVVADPQFDGAASRRGQHFARAVEAINASDVDFVVIAGDLVDHRNREGVLPDFTGSLDDSRTLFREFKQIASKLTVPWYVAAGNHEHLARPGVRTTFLEEFGLERAYYGIDLGGARFLFLEGVEEQGWRPDSAQMTWLEEELQTHSEKDVFVVTHYAVVDDPFVFDRDRGRMPKVQELLESHGRVRAVYNGHKNVISATSENGILYVTTPSPSSTPYGYFRVRVFEEGLLQNLVSTPGTKLRLDEPRMKAGMAPNPYILRQDPLYRWGRPEARNFAWAFPDASTSIGGAE